MSGATKPGPGRPPGISEATLEKRRMAREAAKLDIPVAKIAALLNCAPAYVRMLINDGAGEDGAAEQGGDAAPQPPRRMTARTLRSRAWDYADRNAAPSLSLASCDFWVRLVIAIHENGDGFRLHIGEPGRRFRVRSDLTMLRMGQVSPYDVDVDGWLTALVEHGRLVDIDGVDIGIPEGLGLTPTPGKRRRATPKAPAGGDDRRQETMLHTLPGGLSDASKNTPMAPSEGELNLRSDANLIPPERKFNSRTAPLAQATTTTTNELNSFNSCSSSPLEPRAGDGELNLRFDGIKFAPGRKFNSPAASVSDASKNTPMAPSAASVSDASKNTPMAPSEALRLSRQVGELCGYGAPTPADVATVGEWLGYPGVSEPLIVSAIAEDRRKPDPLPVHSLGLFTKTVKAALSIEKARTAARAPPAPASPAAPPLSEAEKAAAAARGREQAALEHRTGPLLDWYVQHRTGPRPPLTGELQKHCEAGRREPAFRWMAVLDAVRATDDPSLCLKLPPFESYVASPAQYEDMMTEAEEAVTAPAAIDDG